MERNEEQSDQREIKINGASLIEMKNQENTCERENPHLNNRRTAINTKKQEKEEQTKKSKDETE